MSSSDQPAAPPPSPNAYEAFRVIDNFCPLIDEVRQSFLDSGFGTWLPNKGLVGSSVYEGMNFQGRHSYMLDSLQRAMSGVYPIAESMFARVTNEGTEKAYVHSDRQYAGMTAIVYLSKHPDSQPSGTAFFRHRRSGLELMPTFQEMQELGIFEELKHDMVNEGDNPDVWEQTNYVQGKYNRAVIFAAPLFHARRPSSGIGHDPVTGRMVWVCHFQI